MLVAINADSEPDTAHFDAGCGMAVDLISGENHDFGGGSQLAPYSAYFWDKDGILLKLPKVPDDIDYVIELIIK